MSDLLTLFFDPVQTQLEASRRIADALFSGAVKLDHALLDVTHRAVDEQLRFAKAVTNTRDPQTYFNLHSTYWTSKPDELNLFQKRTIHIIALMQVEFGRAARSCIEQMNVRSTRGLAFNLFGSGGHRGLSAVNPFGGVMSVWQTAMRGMSSVGNQAIATVGSGAARAGMNAAQAGTHAIEKAVVGSAHQPPYEPGARDDAGAKSDSSNSQPHYGGRHRDGVENRAEQRRAGPTRRK